MKKRYIILIASAGILIVGIGYKKMMHANVFDDIKSTVSQLGDRAEACASVVPAAAEFAAKKAAYETAKIALDIAIALNQADPDIAKLIAANQGMEAAKTGIDVGAAAGKFGVQAISELGQTVGKVLSSGLNISKVEFDANVADLKAGKLPMFAIEGTAAGKNFKIKVQANLKDKLSFAKSVFEALKSVI